MGEFPFGSGGEPESWAGEVPYRGRANLLPSPALAQRGHPDPRRSRHHACIYPQPRAEQTFPRASQEPLCKVPAFALPPAVGNPSPFLATWGYCLCSRECAQQMTRRQAQETSRAWAYKAPDLGCTSVTTAHLTTCLMRAASGPVPSAWHDLCHCPG